MERFCNSYKVNQIQRWGRENVEETITLINLDEKNLEESGCYCLRSKPKSSGYMRKNNWLKGKFKQGLKYVKIMENNKQAGFIEYVPIEHSSRVVYGLGLQVKDMLRS